MKRQLLIGAFGLLSLCACSDGDDDNNNGGGGNTATGGAGNGTGGQGGQSGDRFVGTWATGPQLTEPNNLPPEPGLSGNTLRQVVYTSIGGSRIRLRLSNEFGNDEVKITSVHIAVSSGPGTIDTATDQALSFSGEPAVTIEAGDYVYSDTIDYDVDPLTKMAITMHFDTAPSDVTGHPGSRTKSYLAEGDVVTDGDLSSAVTTEHWYYITGLDVVSANGSAVVTLGDSITDGRGTTTDGNNRWPDFLSRRLRDNQGTEEVAVLNQGIGGNAVLTGGLGPTALDRFQRDVLDMRGAKYVIVYEGVNDIGGASAADSPMVAEGLIDAFRSFIDQAHAHDMKIYGVPITPFAGSQYDSPEHLDARNTVNDWIRMSGEFDDVIDFDPVVADPENPDMLKDEFTDDFLHLNPEGYEAMAESIDLDLFK